MHWCLVTDFPKNTNKNVFKNQLSKKLHVSLSLVFWYHNTKYILVINETTKK